mmetsp:Transcript_13733/g.61640  ORF Transcript_13733/g.61640 Transcript_13733/m.61640 type:complete len:312 (-) Transcript_13733:85-1020(-)
MKIVSKSEPRAKLDIVQGTSIPIDTPPHTPNLHGCFIFTGRRNIGKSTQAVALLRMYKEAGCLSRLLVVSPSFNSNLKLMKTLDVNPEDVFDNPDEPGLIRRILNIIEMEKEDFLRWQHLKQNYDRILKQIKMGIMPKDELLMEMYDYSSNEFRMPKPKYECYKKGKPPTIFLLQDDCMATKYMTDRLLTNLVIKHRHLGQLPTGGAVGLTLLFTIQSYKATSGLPKPIRNNATGIAIFRTRDKSEFKAIQESFGSEVDEEVFAELYEYATKDSLHDFLFIDINKLKPGQSMFRKNWDEYLFVEPNSSSKI